MKFSNLFLTLSSVTVSAAGIGLGLYHKKSSESKESDSLSHSNMKSELSERNILGRESYSQGRKVDLVNTSLEGDISEIFNGDVNRWTGDYYVDSLTWEKWYIDRGRTDKTECDKVGGSWTKEYSEEQDNDVCYRAP